MWKNLGKGAIWFAIYFALQNIFSTVFAFAYLYNTFDTSNIVNDAEQFISAIVDAVFATALPALIVSAIIMILIYIVHRHVIKQPLYIKTVHWKKVVFFAGFACWVNVISNAFVWLSSAILPQSWLDALGQSVDVTTTGHDFWLMLLGTGLLIPIMEEIVFRYGLHGYLAKDNVKVAYIFSSVVFGLVHGNPIQIVFATLLGLLLSFTYQRTKNLWYPIIIHAVSNSASVTSMFFESELVYCITFAGIGFVLMSVSLLALNHTEHIFSKMK